MSYLVRFVDLQNDLNGLNYDDSQKRDEIQRKIKLYIRNTFLEPITTQYLQDLAEIRFSPQAYSLSNADEAFRRAWQRGKQQPLNLLTVIIEDISLRDAEP